MPRRFGTRAMCPAPVSAALALAFALLAGGCSVNVDGAPCLGPGTSDACPDGQACGIDGRCSARALACKESFCNPGEGRCLDGGTAVAVVCTTADPVCGAWEQDNCAERGLQCGTRRGPRLGACECPPVVTGPKVFADPGGSPLRDAFPYPNGQESPPECRFGRLFDALAAAAALPQGATVQIETGSAGAVEFGEATGEEWPLFVASNVSVEGATAAGPTVIRGTATASAVLSVEGTVEDVSIHAEGATTGVTVTAPGAQLVRTVVKGAAGPALEVDVSADPATATTVEVRGGSYGGSKVGIWLRRGRVELAPDPEAASSAVASENPGSTIVAWNAEDGVVIGGDRDILLDPVFAEVDATLDHVFVEANGGAGIVVKDVASTSQVRIIGCDIHRNGGTDPASYGGGSPRHAGGALVSVEPAAGLHFHGNRLWSNAYDQLGFESNSSWSIAPEPSSEQCGPQSNVFACVAEGSYAVALLGTTGSVDATWSVWPTRFTGDQYVNANVRYAGYCVGNEGTPPFPACP